MREIKFRAWDKRINDWFRFGGGFAISWDATEIMDDNDATEDISNDIVLQQFTGLHDKNNVEIYEGDILEFADKWEWYRNSYGIKMRFADPERRKELQEQYDKEPMERRVIEIPGCYEWLLSTEIQTYWQVIGNIYQHPEILKPKAVTP